jgi:phytoene dehydrogenase-like protein
LLISDLELFAKTHNICRRCNSKDNGKIYVKSYRGHIWMGSFTSASRKGRLAHRTPIHGIYLSGHWSRSGGGLYGVIVSGLETVGLVSGHVDMKEFLQTLTR